jgi:predicted acylesterase/phospholipase RssA
MFAGIVFAGGGNRCYWQNGFWQAAAGPLALAPERIVGVSAGAFQACLALLGVGAVVKARVEAECRTGRRNIEWRRLLSRQSPFPVGSLFASLMHEIFGEAELELLRRKSEVLIAVSRPPPLLPLSLAIPLGIGGYQIEKKWRAPVHPRTGRRLGFRPEFISVRDLKSPRDLAATIAASASVPPFMPVGRVGERPALDGGLVDNVPVEPLAELEGTGRPTLVLLTRRYKALPQIANRTYVQPSEPIGVRQFSIDEPDGICAAYELGLKDGAAFARSVRKVA